jgi:hypothetical protein
MLNKIFERNSSQKCSKKCQYQDKKNENIKADWKINPLSRSVMIAEENKNLPNKASIGVSAKSALSIENKKSEHVNTPARNMCHRLTLYSSLMIHSKSNLSHHGM